MPGANDEAIAIFEPLLADHERILGIDHPQALITRHNLALAYLESGRVGEALTIFEALLTSRERILGPDHPETLRTRNDLGRAYLTRDAPTRQSRSTSPCSPIASECSAPSTPKRSPYMYYGD